MTLIERVTSTFAEVYGEFPQLRCYAPGRVNLIGEHTDYNDGFVLPSAINMGTAIVGSPRNDGIISVTSADYETQTVTFEPVIPIPQSSDAQWSNYIRGVVHVLLEAGHGVSGANIVVGGNLPQRVGLSSSASLEVAAVTLLSAMNNLGITPKNAALLGQRAEKEYVGCNCGIMDQLISSMGQENAALLIDCRTLETQPTPIPDDWALVIIHSNVKRALVDSAYNERREQCEAAARALGAAALRDVTIEQLEDARASLDPTTYRRARHVVTENARTLQAAQTLKDHNMGELSQLMAASHRSLKFDFEVTVPQIDALVDIVANAIGNEGGVRMTGGGFGGCVVAVAKSSNVSTIQKAVKQHYTKQTGLVADIYVCTASAGATVI